MHQRPRGAAADAGVRISERVRERGNGPPGGGSHLADRLRGRPADGGVAVPFEGLDQGRDGVRYAGPYLPDRLGTQAPDFGVSVLKPADQLPKDGAGKLPDLRRRVGRRPAHLRIGGGERLADRRGSRGVPGRECGECPGRGDTDEWVRVPSDWSRNIVSGRTYDLATGEGERLLRECLERAAETAEAAEWREGLQDGRDVLRADGPRPHDRARPVFLD